LFYYQGALDYSDYQESVSYRSIGLAVTSNDEIKFSKVAENPVLAWTPNNGEEEGVASVAAATHPSGNIYAFYGANTQSGEKTVSADARWASSHDGRKFIDRGIAIDHRDRNVFGHGDELFPVAAIHHSNNWFVYYIPNGTMQTGRLGVAWGSDADALDKNGGVDSGSGPIRVWGMQSVISLCGNKVALFLSNIRAKSITVHIGDLGQPTIVSQPVETYRFRAPAGASEIRNVTFLLDRDSGYWYMLSRNNSRYDIHRALYKEW
jgi:hypothetical protein